jgi:hypothetical protein
MGGGEEEKKVRDLKRPQATWPNTFNTKDIALGFNLQTIKPHGRDLEVLGFQIVSVEEMLIRGLDYKI